jgi:hypothetical protein
MNSAQRPPGTAGGSLLERLGDDSELISVELRPPRLSLPRQRGMDAWIDTYHAIRALARRHTHLFMTDRALGAAEEENLRHLAVNVGADVDRSLITQFLTAKHPLAYCLEFPGRALEHGFRSLVVLGGDRHDEIPRCVEHACELRQRIRERFPGITLGGWANPHHDPLRQVGFIRDPSFCADFYLTQVVSHYNLAPVEKFLDAARAHGVTTPGVFGVFYYRSARSATLEALSRFISVPATELTRDFEDKHLDADTICARTIQALRGLGVRKFYISNLGIRGSARRLAGILQRL